MNLAVLLAPIPGGFIRADDVVRSQIALKDNAPEKGYTADEAKAASQLQDFFKDEARNQKTLVETFKKSQNGKPAVRILVDVMNDKGDEVRRIMAVFILAELGPVAEPSVPSLRAALSDTDPRMRLACIMALIGIGPGAKAAIPELKGLLLGDPDLQVRRGVGHLFEAFGDPAAQALPEVTHALTNEKEDIEVRAKLANALSHLGSKGEPAIPALRTVLRDGPDRLRFLATNALARIGPSAVVATPDLIEAVRAGKADSQVGPGVVYAISRIRPPASLVVSPAAALLNEKDNNVRETAAKLLEIYGEEAAPAVGALVRTLVDAPSELNITGFAGDVHTALVAIGPGALNELRTAMKTSPSPTTRLWAIFTLHEMGAVARPAIPDLASIVDDKDSDVSTLAQTGLVRIARDLQAVADTDAIPDLEAAAAAIQTMLSKEWDDPVMRLPFELRLVRPILDSVGFLKSIVASRKQREAETAAAAQAREAARVKQAALEAELIRVREEARLVNRAVRWAQDQKWALYPIGVAGLLLAGWLIILWRHPLWLFHINETLQLQVVNEWSWVERLSDWTGTAWVAAVIKGGRVPIRFVIFVGFFHYHRRVLDAWMKKPIDDLREAYEHDLVETVAQRKFRVPVKLRRGATPVGADTREEIDPSVEHFRKTFAGRRTSLIISGPGGSGKTSLACQLARWAIDPDPEARLTPGHAMLPILIEGEFDEGSEGKPDFVTTVQRNLKALVPGGVDVPRPLVTKLLEKRRLMVVVDGYSEKTTTAAGVVGLTGDSCPANALVITTRRDGEVASQFPVRAAYTVTQLDGADLSKFLVGYVVALRGSRRAGRGEVTVPEAVTAAGQIGVVVHDRPIPALLARMYADEVVAAKADGRPLLVLAIPDLILTYLNELNRKVSLPNYPDEIVHYIAKSLAWEYLKQEFRPLPLLRAKAIETAGGIEQFLYLHDRLQIIQTISPAKLHVQFSLDPVAEYLAGLLKADECGSDETAWNAFLNDVEAISKGATNIRDFLLAIQDCAEPASGREGAPDSIRKRLANLTGGLPFVPDPDCPEGDALPV